MDSEAALDLVRKGSTLLLIDVPQFTLLGIDTQVFTIGPIFKGVKMIPPGTHFVYYSSSNRGRTIETYAKHQNDSVKNSDNLVIVREWNQQVEQLTKVSVEEERCTISVKSLEFDKQLGPYGLDHFGDWKHLSNYITKSIIDQIEPIGGDILVSGEFDIFDTDPKTTMEKALLQQLRNSKFSKPPKNLRKGVVTIH